MAEIERTNIPVMREVAGFGLRITQTAEHPQSVTLHQDGIAQGQVANLAALLLAFDKIKYSDEDLAVLADPTTRWWHKPRVTHKTEPKSPHRSHGNEPKRYQVTVVYHLASNWEVETTMFFQCDEDAEFCAPEFLNARREPVSAKVPVAKESE